MPTAAGASPRRAGPGSTLGSTSRSQLLPADAPYVDPSLDGTEREVHGESRLNYYSHIRPPHLFFSPEKPAGPPIVPEAPPSPTFKLPVTAMSSPTEERRLGLGSFGRHTTGSAAARPASGSRRPRPLSPPGVGAPLRLRPDSGGPGTGTPSTRPLSSRPVSALTANSSCYGRVDTYVPRPTHVVESAGLGEASPLYAQFEARVEAARDMAWAPEQARMEAAIAAATAALASGQENVRVLDFLSPGASRPPELAAADGPVLRVLELRCQFDALAQKGDQRGRAGRPVYPVPPPRAGPLRTLFEWYARKDDAVEDIMESQMLNANELLALMEDFDLVPRLVRRSEVHAAFKAALGDNRKVLGMRPGELDYVMFQQFLVRLSLLVYGRPPHALPTPAERLETLMEALDIASADTKKLRVRLAHLQRTQRIRVEQKAARKWEYVTGPPPLPESVMRAALGPENPFTDGLLMLQRHDFKPSFGPSNEWREYSLPGLDVGEVPRGAQRTFRVVLRNRSVKQVITAVRLVNLPFFEPPVAQLPLPAGLPRVLELSATFREHGEWLGELVVYAYAIDTGALIDTVQLPVYAKCMGLLGQRLVSIVVPAGGGPGGLTRAESRKPAASEPSAAARAAAGGDGGVSVSGTLAAAAAKVASVMEVQEEAPPAATPAAVSD